MNGNVNIGSINKKQKPPKELQRVTSQRARYIIAITFYSTLVTNLTLLVYSLTKKVTGWGHNSHISRTGGGIKSN
jgi:hypothetical protein